MFSNALIKVFSLHSSHHVQVLSQDLRIGHPLIILILGVVGGIKKMKHLTHIFSAYFQVLSSIFV